MNLKGKRIMFVPKNDLPSVKAYFSERLNPFFSSREIQQITKALVIFKTNCSTTDYLLGDLRFSESDLLFFHSSAKRLQANEPLQHILGTTEFAGLVLKSDERALIPRPETEELVDWIAQNHKKAKTIVDFCAGSGCIALGLKNEIKNADVLAVEWSEKAISLMEENAKFTDLAISIHRFDALTKNYPTNFSADVWVSNPPYIPKKEKALMKKNVLDFEPEMALFVPDETPLIFYRVIAQNAIRLLNENGWLYFEIHENLAKETIDEMKKIGFLNIELRKDLQGKDRMLRGQKVSSENE